ncbi:acyltransferase family protein [Gracilibacillus phocaeensis]|uniref:acyltransferase family protein n=1 Tax=Gracilibacillus phocaeensis TaxID=2042304 RepID=UPI001031C4AE|nr:acyltransferase [Gracilibacillus phocaeensis]
MSNRMEQLDSLRGLAALVVLFSHIPYFAFSLPPVVYQALVWLGFTDGYRAVMLFFLLSGFVLSLPFLRKDKLDYLPYVIKRLFRIYLPYLSAIVFAMILSQIFLNQDIAAIGDWNLLWKESIRMPLVTEHLLFLGNYHTNAFNGVIWSLVHELRISLIFPFLMLVVKRLNWKIIITIALLLSGISALNTMYRWQESVGYHTDYFKTLQYTAFFLFGSLMAKHRKELTAFFHHRKFLSKCALLFMSLGLFQFSNFGLHVAYQLTGISFFSTHFNTISEYGIVLGCIGIVVCAFGSVKLTSVLQLKPFLFLGRISYSLYLFHLPVILTCLYLLQGLLPLWMISVIAMTLSFGIAALAWLAIENPAQKMGRKLAQRTSDKQQVWVPKKKTV